MLWTHWFNGLREPSMPFVQANSRQMSPKVIVPKSLESPLPRREQCLGCDEDGVLLDVA